MQTIAEQLREEGIKIGEEKGKKEGLEEKAIETAKKMLEDGLPFETISRYTGLTEKEVKALIN
jgi:predicted transposase/invertase (TIGR01784 family)